MAEMVGLFKCPECGRECERPDIENKTPKYCDHCLSEGRIIELILKSKRYPAEKTPVSRRWIKFCPQCGSTELTPSLSNKTGLTRWTCDDCRESFFI